MGSNGFVAAVGAYTSGQIIWVSSNDRYRIKKVAEKLNGRLAMLGIIAGLGAYLTTGQIIGLYKWNHSFKQYYGASIH